MTRLYKPSENPETIPLRIGFGRSNLDATRAAFSHSGGKIENRWRNKIVRLQMTMAHTMIAGLNNGTSTSLAELGFCTNASLWSGRPRYG